MSHTAHLLALHRGCNLTFLRYQALKSFFHNDWEKAFQSSLSDWQAAGVDKQGIEKFFAHKSKLEPQQELEKITACQAQVITCDDPGFPLPLTFVYPEPALLFVRGSLELSDFPSLAVVGSRKVTNYGKSALESLLTPLIKTGVTTVSGLAYGTDKLAHECSLKHGQRTIAVLGNGIDFIYPNTHHALAHKIITENQGAIISEYLPGVRARPQHFPQRNRIVAGLAKATVLVEASEKSGTLITAAWANDQGKDILAIPGSIFSGQSAGTNRLIAQGQATSLVDPQQLLQLYGRTENAKNGAPKTKLSDIDRDILNLWKTQSQWHIDEITRELNYPPNVISSQLMMLEVRGWLQDTGQQVYVKLC